MNNALIVKSIENAIDTLRAKQINVLSEINGDKDIAIVYFNDVELELKKIISLMQK